MSASHAEEVSENPVLRNGAPQSALRSRLVIRASAGSGKTYQLSTRFIAQLNACGPERILATTFTRKAAGEILERVLLRLADAALDDARRNELARSLGVNRLPRDLCLDLLCRLARQLHRVRVATLDSFFSRVAGAFALELGLPPGWRILDEIEDEELRSRAIETVLREGDRQDIVQLIHLLAKGEAVRSVTRLVRDTVDELYTIYLETPESAWGPLNGPPLLSQETLAAAVEELQTAPLPQDKRWEKACAFDLASIEASDWDAFISKGLANKILCGEETYCDKPIEPHLRSIYRRLLQHAAGLECRILSEQLAAARNLLARFDAAYRAQKRDFGGLTFDDIARRLAEEFQQHDPDGLAFRLDAQVRHLLLDEFQDTSLTQWTVLEPLAKSVVERDDASFFCVGDVKQAIYGWRGGVAEIFDTVTSRLPGLSTECLDVSFRSAPPIIETVNEVFRSRDAFPLLPEQEETFLQWVRTFPPHATHLHDQEGYASLQVGPEPAEGQPQKEAVLAGAAEFIERLLPQLPEHVTVGVLVRTNDAVGRLIHELRRRNVPASEEGGNPLNDSAAVQLVLSALRLADHPGDTIARFHVAHSPLGACVDLPPGHDDADAEHAAEHIRRALLTRGYGSVIYDWSRVLAGCCTARELDRLRQLVTLADGYDAIASLRASDFARYVETCRVEDPRAARVRVMTVHKAKGLEFDVVVLPQLDEPLIRPARFVTWRPSPAENPVLVCRYRNRNVQRLLPPDVQQAFQQTADRALREALCVFYVALTRAARALYMFVAPRSRESKTCAGILRAVLAPGKPCEPGAVLYECGREDWYARLPSPTTDDEQPTLVRTPIRLQAGERSRGRELRAPSHFKPRRSLTINDVLHAAGAQALARGQLLHAWFESLRWIDDGPPSDDDLRRIAQRGGFAGEIVEECAREFRNLLSAPSLQELLSVERYRRGAAALFATGLCDGPDVEITVETERRFDVPSDRAILSGSIDRLVLFRRNGAPVAADILDYKSDALRGDPDEAVARLVELYSGQLEAYARAVTTMYGVPRDNIVTRLVLLESQQVVKVEADGRIG